MRCAFCGQEFDASAAEVACHGCAMLGGCRKVRCPHCGYESPAEPGLVKWLRRLKERWHARSAS